MEFQPLDIVLIGGLLAAAAVDARTGRIPNLLTGAMMVAGLGGWMILGDPLVGLLGFAASLIHFGLWVLGVEKAGDAKLFMGIGACVGWAELLEATFWTAVVYLPVGLALLAATGELGNLVRLLRAAVGHKVEGDLKPTMLRTAPIIAVGGLLARFTDIFPLP